MKKIALYIIILTQTIFLVSCASDPAIKYYESNERISTNLPNVYVKNFQCWSYEPINDPYYENTIALFTIDNQSSCDIKKDVTLILYEGNIRKDKCHWDPEEYSYRGELKANSAHYGTTSKLRDCHCDQFKRIEFKVKKDSEYCN